MSDITHEKALCETFLADLKRDIHRESARARALFSSNPIFFLGLLSKDTYLTYLTYLILYL